MPRPLLARSPLTEAGGSCHATAREVEPKLYRAIMVSSTFTDLEAHRREVIDATHRFGSTPGTHSTVELLSVPTALC